MQTGWAEQAFDIHIKLIRLRLASLSLSRDLIARRLAGLSAKYRPDQPRVPAGSPEGGQWTDGNGGSDPMSFEEWLAGGWASGLGAIDADQTTGDGSSDWKLPDDETEVDWANGRGRGGGSPWSNATPGQHARWAASELQAQGAIRRVQALDPRWRPPASMSEGIEGAILSNQATIRQAEARLLELRDMRIGPGQFAVESIPVRGPGRANAREQAEIDRIGSLFGCHTCGTMNPGTPSGSFVLDHQIPTALNPLGAVQRGFPHCWHCSRVQGGYTLGLKRRR